VLLGVYPSVLTDTMQGSFDDIIAHLNSRMGG
jgi:NADH:ubiquinone oxidoreductase subunit 4 (subunit M)